jgi:hypothetical protein
LLQIFCGVSIFQQLTWFTGNLHSDAARAVALMRPKNFILPSTRARWTVSSSKVQEDEHLIKANHHRDKYSGFNNTLNRPDQAISETLPSSSHPNRRRNGNRLRIIGNGK